MIAANHPGFLGLNWALQRCIPVLSWGSAMLHSTQGICQIVNCSIPAYLFCADPEPSLPSALLRDPNR